MLKRIIPVLGALALWFGAPAAEKALPVTGTWINFAWKDMRNDYTNPSPPGDAATAAMWTAKVNELADIGMEYLVIMEVANEGRAYYPSSLMPRAWSYGATSPLDALLDAAASRGMKVFLSTGWAKDQDDNLRDPAIKARQLAIMDELAAIYKDHTAFYGWYLPVEDCLCPVMSQHAVDAVNALTDHAREVAPGKVVLISPYGISMSDYNDPNYEKRLGQLKVDVIAYQDEVGCVREPYPLPALKQNWKRLRGIHDRIGIAMWANCETFTWENEPNSRKSALVPADYQRLLAQQVAATDGGVERIVSFMFPGIVEKPGSAWQLGQPGWSNRLYDDYESWRSDDPYWALSEAALRGALESDTAVTGADPALVDGEWGELTPDDTRWRRFGSGEHCIDLTVSGEEPVGRVVIRLLDSRTDGLVTPTKFCLMAATADGDFEPVALADSRQWSNDRLDCRQNIVVFDGLDLKTRALRIVFTVADKTEAAIDEITVNPRFR